ncbi:hypothetical protein [Absidia glauca]|uniref:Uncharacterized protein n=1 Tax=Absidia glauca TaxID=4829 RepID=A0A163K9D7_ABSGL|nr:hypothetical protein [Absidia glauca]
MSVVELDQQHRGDNSAQGKRSWSLVTRSGINNKRIPNSMPRQDEYGEKERRSGRKKMWLTNWLPGRSLLFSNAQHIRKRYTLKFRKQDFKHYTDAFALVSKEIGPLKGVRRVTRYSYQTSSKLMVEFQFKDPTGFAPLLLWLAPRRCVSLCKTIGLKPSD